MGISESQLAGLPFDEQVLTVVNEERIDRGLPPIDDITSRSTPTRRPAPTPGPTRPSPPRSPAAGSHLGRLHLGRRAVIALEADYYWMYDDGYSGASTTNALCTLSNPGECWGHRDIILHEYANCPSGPPVLSMGAAYSPNGYSGGSVAAIFASSCQAPSDVTLTSGQAANTVASSSRTIGIAPLPNGTGYWEAEANGTVAAFGSAPSLVRSAARSTRPSSITATPNGGGYWLVGSDGGVFSFGNAAFYGSTGSLRLNKPIVGLASTPDGQGYWMVASDGGIFSFGDAAFHGSMGGQPLNQPIVGLAADPRTGGYWEVASDGGIFSFDAPFYGSTGSIRLNQPIVGMEPTSDGGGYRFVAADGGIFTFGNASFDGSTGGTPWPLP